MVCPYPGVLGAPQKPAARGRVKAEPPATLVRGPVSTAPSCTAVAPSRADGEGRTAPSQAASVSGRLGTGAAGAISA